MSYFCVKLDPYTYVLIKLELKSKSAVVCLEYVFGIFITMTSWIAWHVIRKCIGESVRNCLYCDKFIRFTNYYRDKACCV